MSDTQLLRQMVNERLAAAAEEIFGLIEKTVTDYQEQVFCSRSEISRLKQEIEQLSVLKPEVKLLRTDVRECVMQQPDQIPALEESDTLNPEQIKEEQEELCISQDMEADSHEDCQDPLSEIEPEHISQNDCQPFPVSSEITSMHKDEDDWNESDNSSSVCSPSHSKITLTKNKSARKDKRKRRTLQTDPPKTCRFCCEHFQTNTDLLTHMDKIHMGVKAFKCTQCDKVFEQKHGLVLHVRVHTDVQACALDQPDQNPTLENSHTPDHEQAEEEQLDLCSISDPEEPDCYEDYQVPLSDSDLTCPPITVSTMSFKEEEKWNEIDNSVSPSCDPMYSDIPFTAKKPAQRDQMKRSPIQKNQNKTCRLCHICFQSNAELKRHMDTNHMGEKAYKCNQCDKGFDVEYHLAVHVRIHTGEKPYSCDFCGKTFTQNSNRIVHMRQHTGERPYYCINCDKSFTNSHHLRWCAEKQNKGEKNPFRCRICGKTFNTDLDLRLHKEVHMSWKRHLEENQHKAV